jgi:hypothetical protein
MQRLIPWAACWLPHMQAASLERELATAAEEMEKLQQRAAQLEAEVCDGGWAEGGGLCFLLPRLLARLLLRPGASLLSAVFWRMCELRCRAPPACRSAGAGRLWLPVCRPKGSIQFFGGSLWGVAHEDIIHTCAAAGPPSPLQLRSAQEREAGMEEEDVALALQLDEAQREASSAAALVEAERQKMRALEKAKALAAQVGGWVGRWAWVV